METPKLMWVVSDGPETDRKKLSDIRRHVMLDFLAKPTSNEAWPRTQRKKKSLSPPSKPLESPAAPAPPTTAPTAPPTERAPPKKTRPSKRNVQTKRTPPEPAPKKTPPVQAEYYPLIPSPAAALTNPNDRQICDAARWYFHDPFAQQGVPSNWRSRRFNHLSTSMWNTACEDEAMREIFMMTAAVKEGQATGMDTTKARLLHQGNAIRLVSKQLSKRRNSPNSAALVLMSILSKDAFAEQDYVAAAAHMKAISASIADRMHTAPWYLWYFIVWTDLTICGVNDRPSELPFYLPPECCVPLPESESRKANKAACKNVKYVPMIGTGPFTEELAFELFENLHRVAFVYSNDDTDWRLASRVCYEAAMMIANGQQAPIISTPGSQVPMLPAPTILLLVMRLVMYGTAAPFFSEAGPQVFFQAQILTHLQICSPAEACDLWGTTDQLRSLIWALFNISISVICYPTGESELAESRQLWLRETLQIAIEKLEAQNAVFSWVNILINDFPYISTWHERWFRPFHDWLETGIVPDTAVLRQAPAPFSNSWKVFKPPGETADLTEIDAEGSPIDKQKLRAD